MNESRPGETGCSCRDLEGMLAAYVDGEAPSHECGRVRAHLEACAGCRDRLAGERAVRDVLQTRRGGLRPSAPETLKARCAAYAPQRRTDSAATPRATQPSRPVSRRGRRVLHWAPLSLAATILLAVATVFGFGLTDKSQALAFQTTLDHVKCSRFNAGSTPLDADQAAKQWQAKFGWAIAAPEPSRASGLELRGVRRCGVMDGRVAHLIYDWMGESLSVYVLPKRTLGESAQFVNRFGHNSIMWSRNDRTYIIVTPHRRDASLDAMVAYVRATAY